jgi:hypothetical protein
VCREEDGALQPELGAQKAEEQNQWDGELVVVEIQLWNE